MSGCTSLLMSVCSGQRSHPAVGGLSSDPPVQNRSGVQLPLSAPAVRQQRGTSSSAWSKKRLTAYGFAVQASFKLNQQALQHRVYNGQNIEFDAHFAPRCLGITTVLERCWGRPGR